MKAKQNKQPEISREELLQQFEKHPGATAQKKFSAFSQRALNGMKYQEGDLRQSLKRLDGKIKRNNRPAILPKLAAAASIALLLALSYIYLPYAQEAGAGQGYTAYFDYPVLVLSNVERGKAEAPQSSTASLLSRAAQTYQAGSYSDAEGLLRAYISQVPDDGEAQFYFAVVLLGQDKASGAKPILERLKNNLPAPNYKRPVDWYLALACIAEGEPEQARGLLLSLSQGDDRYARLARLAINQLF